MPVMVPLSEADLEALFGMLERHYQRRRAIMVQPDGRHQYCLPPAKRAA